MWSRTSRRRVPTTRSQWALAFGARTGVLMISMPSAWNTASKASAYLLSRSRMRKRGESTRMPRSVARLRACWVVQAAVGCAVTPATCRRRVPCSRKTRAYRRFRLMVSMWRKSQAIRPVACAVRNSRQVGPVWRGAGSIPELAMPGRQRAGGDGEDLGPAAARDQGGQGGEPQAVCGFVPYSSCSWRRSTAFSWRRTRSSATFEVSRRRSTVGTARRRRVTWYRSDTNIPSWSQLSARQVGRLTSNDEQPAPQGRQADLHQSGHPGGRVYRLRRFVINPSVSTVACSTPAAVIRLPSARRAATTQCDSIVPSSRIVVVQ